jgi:hypothetical protein
MATLGQQIGEAYLRDAEGSILATIKDTRIVRLPGLFHLVLTVARFQSPAIAESLPGAAIRQFKITIEPFQDTYTFSAYVESVEVNLPRPIGRITMRLEGEYVLRLPELEALHVPVAAHREKIIIRLPNRPCPLERDRHPQMAILPKTGSRA